MSVNKRREREREARRNRILDAAQEEFLGRGFDAATMGDVADRAELGKGTLYNYFSTKEELLLGVVVRHQQEVIRSFEQAAREADSGLDLVRRLMLGFMAHISHPPGRLKMVMSRWASGQRFDAETRACAQLNDNVRHIMRIFTGAIIRGQQDGSIRDNCDPMAATMSMWAATMGTLLHQLQLDVVPEPNPFAGMIPSREQSVEFYLQALRPELAAPRHSQVKASGSTRPAAMMAGEPAQAAGGE